MVDERDAEDCVPYGVLVCLCQAHDVFSFSGIMVVGLLGRVFGFYGSLLSVCFHVLFASLKSAAL